MNIVAILDKNCFCHAAELVRKTPLFPGDSEVQELLLIFKLLGTPSENLWPGVTCLRDWHDWPQWKAADLRATFPELEPAGLDLMKQCLQYIPGKRISAKEALNHPYFDDLDKTGW